MSETSQSDANLNLNINKIVNDALRVFFKDAVRIALTSPSQSVFFCKIKQLKQGRSWKAKDFMFHQS
jgi:hypothetical protein